MAIPEPAAWWARLDADVRWALMKQAQGSFIPNDVAMKVGMQAGLEMRVRWDTGPEWSAMMPPELLEFVRQKAAEATA